MNSWAVEHEQLTAEQSVEREQWTAEQSVEREQWTAEQLWRSFVLNKNMVRMETIALSLVRMFVCLCVVLKSHTSPMQIVNMLSIVCPNVNNNAISLGSKILSWFKA